MKFVKSAVAKRLAFFPHPGEIVPSLLSVGKFADRIIMIGKQNHRLITRVRNSVHAAMIQLAHSVKVACGSGLTSND